MEINTIRYWSSHEVVAATDLKAGDIIIEHGGRFALSNKQVFEGLPEAGHTVSFDGIYLGPAFSGEDCAIPEHWRKNVKREDDPNGYGYWRVQGNRYAMRCRITDPRPMYYWGTNPETGMAEWRHEPKAEGDECTNCGARFIDEEQLRCPACAELRDEYEEWHHE